MNPVGPLNLKNLLAMQFLLGAVLTAAVYSGFGSQLGASFAIGAVIMLGNLLMLAWMWSRILEQKSIARTVVIIVVKYTVLLGAIFILTHKTWFHVLGAGLGMATFIMTALFHVALMSRERV